VKWRNAGLRFAYALENELLEHVAHCSCGMAIGLGMLRIRDRRQFLLSLPAESFFQQRLPQASCCRCYKFATAPCSSLDPVWSLTSWDHLAARYQRSWSSLHASDRR
jgi:hypothetical protein